MYSNRQLNQDSPEVQKLRQEAGAWIRGLREAAGLSQRELAAAVGLDYYSFISQVESGKGRVPTSQIEAWAKALQVPARDFAITLLKHYDPVNYALIFGEPVVEAAPPKLTLIEMNDRIARIESLLDRKA